jgi:hemolysin III
MAFPAPQDRSCGDGCMRWSYPLQRPAEWIPLTVATYPVARMTCLVFLLTDCRLSGARALDHVGRWQPRTAVVLRRFDRSSILLIIVGGWTPIAVLRLLLEMPRSNLLVLVWAPEITGITTKVIWSPASRWLSAVSYLTVGGVTLVFVPDSPATRWAVVLTFVYPVPSSTSGGIVYAFRRPDPWAVWFGFHRGVSRLGERRIRRPLHRRAAAQSSRMRR